MNLSENIAEADDDGGEGDPGLPYPNDNQTYHTRQADFKTGS